MEITDIKSHIEWLEKVNNTKISDIRHAKPMPGMEFIPLDGLVVSNTIKDWDNIKQQVIPLKPAEGDEEPARIARQQLSNMRAKIMSNNGFFVLVKDEQMGGENGLALSIIKPEELDLPEDKLMDGM